MKKKKNKQTKQKKTSLTQSGAKLGDVYLKIAFYRCDTFIYFEGKTRSVFFFLPSSVNLKSNSYINKEMLSQMVILNFVKRCNDKKSGADTGFWRSGFERGTVDPVSPSIPSPVFPRSTGDIKLSSSEM